MKALPKSKLSNCEGIIYACLTLSNSLSINEQKATVFHIKLVLKWLNLFSGMSALAWISGHEVDCVAFFAYLTMPPNVIPRGAFVYHTLIRALPTTSEGKIHAIEAAAKFLSPLKTSLRISCAIKGAD